MLATQATRCRRGAFADRCSQRGGRSARRRGSGGPNHGSPALLDSYLNGIEPVEPLLRARDSALVSELEASFARARLAAERGSPHLQDEGRELVALIDRARRTRTIGQDEFSVFWLSFVILLRESFEAAVVIAALLAVLKKMQQPQSARIVHAGWMSAVVIAGVVFFAFRHVINGRNREQVEGYFSLFAVLMLVYAALWLNARANIRKFMGRFANACRGQLAAAARLPCSPSPSRPCFARASRPPSFSRG